MGTRPDPIFADPRLARIYDDVDGDRSDLDHYIAIIEELGAGRMLDVGCGTGELACRLARSGLDVVGVDPAFASLEVARSKPGADAVTWIHGDVGSLPSDLDPVDIAVMTGNVAQVFLDDLGWQSTLHGIARVLGPNGHVVFETRDPARRAWESWDDAGTTSFVGTHDGTVETWTTLLDVSLPLVTFRRDHRFVGSDEVISSTSTLRFRTLDEICASLADAGFTVDDVRDAPDRPGLEFVVIARVSG